jgi:hypothetical protein
MASFLSADEEIPVSELRDTISRLNNMSSDKDRLRLLRMTVRNFTFTCAQGKQLLDVCQFSSSGIEACMLVHERCHDRSENWKELLKAFKYPDELAELTLKLGAELSVSDDQTATLAPQLTVVAGKAMTVNQDPRFLQKQKIEEQRKAMHLAANVELANENAAAQGLDQLNLHATLNNVETIEEKTAKAMARQSSAAAEASGMYNKKPESSGAAAASKEQLLTDSEFEVTFGMTKDKFNELPMWKRQNLKKSKGLF